MRIFRSMSLQEAKEWYSELKEVSKEHPGRLISIAMDDIWFFTDGLTKDYGKSEPEEET